MLQIMPVIILLTFISSSLLIYQILKAAFGKNDLTHRLNKYINGSHPEKDGKKMPGKFDLRTGLGLMAKGIKNIKSLDNYKRSVQLYLVKAHILLKPEEFITISFISSVIAGMIGFLLSSSLIGAVLGFAAGWLIPVFFLKSMAKKRIKLLNNQLGDAIMLLSSSLKAGYSFFQAVDTVTKEMSGPISEEFVIMQKEVNLGVSTEKALENLVQRVDSDDLEMIITAVLIQRQVGGNLSEVLDNISSTIRDRIKIKGEVRTITAQGRVSGLVLSLLPVVLGALVYMINPSHMNVLFTNPFGIVLLVFSGIMELIGIFIIRKIVRVEV